MCGIYGSYRLRKDDAALSDLYSFRYRGPDHSGYVQIDDLFLGNNRLAVIDLDARSNQPLRTEDERYYIVFNGEIYNYKELRDSLKAEGVVFSTDSDTEVVLKLFAREGKASFSRLSGMFAIALYDQQEKILTLARDHVGMKPLYYVHQKGEGFSFSSELKGLASSLQAHRISAQSFSLGSVLGYIPSPHTIFSDVFKLEKSTVLEYDLRADEISFSAIGINTEQSMAKTDEELAAVIEKAVLSHLVADAPVGLCFSGGTDSSLIAAILKKNKINLKSYSIVMPHKDEDAHYITSIGEELGLKPTVLNFDVAEFDEGLMMVHEKIDEPTIDSSMIAMYMLSKMAGKEVKVLLSGEGADEFFYGYERHKALRNYRFLKPGLFVRTILCAPIPTIYKRKILKIVAAIRRDGALLYLLETSKRPIIDRSWLPAIEVLLRSAAPLRLDEDHYLENDLLRKMDFATSYASVEGRMPFLDKTVIAAARNFAQEKELERVGKASLKRVLTQFLRTQNVYRGKSGLGLDQERIFNESQYFKPFLANALEGLKTLPEIHRLLPQETAEELIKTAPYYAFFLYSYWCTIKNLKL